MRPLLVLALLLAGCSSFQSPQERLQAHPPTIQEAPAPAAAPVVAYVLVAADMRAVVLDNSGKPLAELAYCGELPGETPAIVFCAEK